MDSEKNLQLLIAIINKIMPGLIIILAGLAVYFFFNAEILRRFINFFGPLALYAGGLSAAYAMRSRKSKRLAEEDGTEMTIKINYFTFFYHDALIFLTPALIIIVAFWLNGEVTYRDILYSAIAMTGLYLSLLIYKRRII